MEKVSCIERFRDKNGTIYGYRIKSVNTGQIIDISPNQLKQAMRANSISCTNLELTKDGRIIQVFNEQTMHN